MPVPVPGVSILARAQKGFREDYKRILKPAVEQISGVIARAANTDGIIDPNQIDHVKTTSHNILQRVFVGSDGRNAYANGATPLAPYPRIVNKWVVYVTLKNIQAHKLWLKRNTPSDLYHWLATARRPERISEMTVPAHMSRNYAPRIFAQYDPTHKWVDKNGYRLSDRIWRTDFETRQRLDAMLDDSISNGTAALTISRQAEQFMLPGRAALRTNKPYGKDASYRGMVLGRTEVTRAHGEITTKSAQLNPFVSGVDWVLSGSHPEDDICDELATVDANGTRLADPYPVDEVPPYPAHPQDLCNLQQVVTADMSSVVDELRSYMDDGEEPPITAAADNTMMYLMLGLGLYEWWQSNPNEVDA